MSTFAGTLFVAQDVKEGLEAARALAIERGLVASCEQQLFKEADTDQSGFLDKDEFAEIKRKVQMRTNVNFDTLDKNKDKKIDMKELLPYIWESSPEVTVFLLADARLNACTCDFHVCKNASMHAYIHTCACVRMGCASARARALCFSCNSLAGSLEIEREKTRSLLQKQKRQP